jgi:hypothetical protein
MNNGADALTFKNDGSTGLPMLGSRLIAETFFNLPSGLAPLAIDTIDNNTTLSSNYTVAGDVALSPAHGSAVVATLSLLAGVELDSSTWSGQATVGEMFEPIVFVQIPEPSMVLLASLALVGFVARRK